MQKKKLICKRKRLKRYNVITKNKEKKILKKKPYYLKKKHLACFYFPVKLDYLQNSIK
jgi:predicted protein tyrosine phosphatase